MVKTQPAIEFHSYPKTWHDVSELPSGDIVRGFGVRFMSDVIRRLLLPYSGDLLLKDNKAYIPWEDSATLLNETFGFFGWDFQEVSKREIIEHNDKKTIAVTYRLSLRVVDDTTDTLLTKVIESPGANAINNFPEAVDTAVKGCASDALSKCCKLLGNAFGLYLYEKEEEQDNTPPPPRFSKPAAKPAPKATGLQKNEKGGYGVASSGQTGVLIKCGFTPEEIASIADWRKVKDTVGIIIEQHVDLSEAKATAGIVDEEKW